MNTIPIFFSNTQYTIGSFTESKITPINVNWNFNYEYAFIIELNKTLLQTLIRELSALNIFSETFYLGVENELAIIVISENQSKMDITYKRSLTFAENSDVDGDYSIRDFITILKNLKTKEPIITISTNQLMVIEDTYNTYTLANKEIDWNAEI